MIIAVESDFRPNRLQNIDSTNTQQNPTQAAKKKKDFVHNIKPPKEKNLFIQNLVVRAGYQSLRPPSHVLNVGFLFFIFFIEPFVFRMQSSYILCIWLFYDKGS